MQHREKLLGVAELLTQLLGSYIDGFDLSIMRTFHSRQCQTECPLESDLLPSTLNRVWQGRDQVEPSLKMMGRFHVF